MLEAKGLSIRAVTAVIKKTDEGGGTAQGFMKEIC